MQERKKITGTPVSRIDGILKVTGKADYSTDHPVKNVAYAVLFKSTIAAGSIASIDVAEAEKAPGVLTIITHVNAPKLNVKGGIRGGAMLQSSTIEFYGQHIGLVVAETFEQARHASHLVKVTYTKSTPNVDFEKLAKQAVPAKDPKEEKRGDTQTALNAADYKVEEVYATPIEHHHPLEPHATIAEWNGDRLTLYNSAQIVNGAQSAAAKTLNISTDQVRIVTPYIGGG
ncbi:MAG: xanthine dehydrogenase family protein molybdopterin-binding subunit, partial [Cytophagaceae bacterium]